MTGMRFNIQWRNIKMNDSENDYDYEDYDEYEGEEFPNWLLYLIAILTGLFWG